MYLDEVEKYLHVALGYYKSLKPGLMEDAIQEGMIQAWRDINDGVEPKLKVLRRAAMCGRRYLHRDGENAFGAPRRSHEGFQYTESQNIVAKVKTYLEEFIPVHDRWPNGEEVAQALGIKGWAARNAINRIKEGRLDHMKYREETPDGRRRKDRNYYHVDHVENFVGQDANANSSWADHPAFTQFQTLFEDELVSDMWFDDMLAKLNANTAKVIELRFKYGYSAMEIGKFRGFTTNISAKGSRVIANAVNQVSILLNPYSGECAAEHARTEDNTLVKTREDGVFTRYCLDCRAEHGTKTKGTSIGNSPKPGAGRRPVPECPKHGPKNYMDTRGSLRCRVCKGEAAKRYLDKKKAADGSS